MFLHSLASLVKKRALSKALFYFAQMFRYNWYGWKISAILWFLFITVLFLLPGSAFPKDNWLKHIYFDKWVHFGFFFILLFLWRFYFPFVFTKTWILIVLAFIYGIGIEIIQNEWIENRSFDMGDVVADVAGAIAGLYIWQKWYKKNRPL